MSRALEEVRGALKYPGRKNSKDKGPVAEWCCGCGSAGALHTWNGVRALRNGRHALRGRQILQGVVGHHEDSGFCSACPRHLGLVCFPGDNIYNPPY